MIEDFMVHSGARFAEISKAEAQAQQRRKLARFIQPWRKANFMEGSPKAIASTCVIVPHSG